MPPPVARFGKMEQRRRFHPLVMAGIVVMLLGAFSVGYQRGADGKYQRRLAELKTKERAVEVKLNQCHERKSTVLDSFAASDTKAKKELATLKRMEAHLAFIQDETDRAEPDLTRCDQDTMDYETRINNQNEEDALLRTEISALRAKVGTLRATMLTESAGEGLDAMENQLSLERLRGWYVDACNQVPGCVVQSNEELLEKFGEAAPNASQVREERETREKAFLSEMPPPLTPSSPNFTAVYFPPTGRDEFESHPLVLGRPVGQAALTNCSDDHVGTRRSEMRTVGLHHGTLAQRLAELEDAALCAHRQQRAGLTFPSHFYSQLMRVQDNYMTRATAYLHRLFTTPHITFTVDCERRSAKNTPADCFEDRVRRHYGGDDFWAMRSRLLPESTVASEAYQFYDAQELVGQATLAVVLRRPEGHECGSYHRRARQPHYIYLKNAFPDDPALAHHGSGSALEECEPTVVEVARRIAELDANAATPYAAIVLVMPLRMRKDVLSLLEKNTTLYNRLQYYESPTGNTDPVRAELVEWEIASRASAILVSAYLTPGGYVTERFLLLHDFTPDGRVFFF